MLSLRPLLLSATKRKRQRSLQQPQSDSSSLSLDAGLIRHCCNTCLITAHDLVGAIHQHLDTAYKSSGWHCVYCRIDERILQTKLILTHCQSLLPLLQFSWLAGNVQKSTLRFARIHSQHVGTNASLSWTTIKSKFIQLLERFRPCKHYEVK